MHWRNKLSLCFIPLLIVFFFIVKEDKGDVIAPKKNTRAVASIPHKIFRKQITDEKMIRRLRGRVLKHSALRYRIPQSVEAKLEKDSGIALTRGHDFLKEVAAIPKEQYRPSMGDVISQNDQFVFFKSSEGHLYTPVAISKTTNTFYPISSILHIKSATPEIREELRAKGLKEYYYHPQLKFLSLETKSGEVMKVYNQLINQGFKVELEVLKPHHQTN